MNDEDQELNDLFANLEQPKGAQWRIDSIFYKRGMFGRLYRFNGEDWVRSNADPRKVMTKKGAIGV